MPARPDYAISLLDVDYQKRQVRLADPVVSIGFKGVWGTQMFNILGETSFGSIAIDEQSKSQGGKLITTIK